jgi:hypothetical protein
MKILKILILFLFLCGCAAGDLRQEKIVPFQLAGEYFKTAEKDN